MRFAFASVLWREQLDTPNKKQKKYGKSEKRVYHFFVQTEGGKEIDR